MVTFLAGGTGTPKVLWGAGSVFDLANATVIANTGDDIVLGSLFVSPDVDSVLFERSARIDRERWWGIAEDGTTTTTQLATLARKVDIDPAPTRVDPTDERPEAWRRFRAVPEFMTIGERDRAHHLVRSELLARGHTLTAATRALADAYDVDCTVLPMSDDPVVSIIETPTGRMHFQEYWVAAQGNPAVDAVTFLGADRARASTAVHRALDAPVVIGPANPITSIGPMLAIDDISLALEQTPVVCVSPFIEDEVFSGPAGALMSAAGYDASTAGLEAALPMVDAFVLDESDHTQIDRTVVYTDTHIESKADATRVAAACADALTEVQ